MPKVHSAPSYHMRGMMTPKRRFSRHRPDRPRQRVWRRHRKMFERAVGKVVRKRRPVRRGCQSQTVATQPRKVWMSSKELCQYLRCCLRHVYWLTLHRRLPYHYYVSRSGPRYVFKTGEVDAWLRRYRGKGRQLGLKRLRFGKNPRASLLQWKGSGMSRLPATSSHSCGDCRSSGCARHLTKIILLASTKSPACRR